MDEARQPCNTCGHPHGSGVACEAWVTGEDLGTVAGEPVVHQTRCGCEARDTPVGPIEPYLSTTVILDETTTVVPAIMPNGTAVAIGSNLLLMFRNLAAIIGFAQSMVNLANAYNDYLPEGHPLRYTTSTEIAEPAEATPIDPEQADLLGKLLEGIDLSGLDGGAS